MIRKLTRIIEPINASFEDVCRKIAITKPKHLAELKSETNNNQATKKRAIITENKIRRIPLHRNKLPK